MAIVAKEYRGFAVVLVTPIVVTLLGFITGYPFWSTIVFRPLIGVPAVVIFLAVVREASQGGYLPASFHPDLKGKNAIVTGGTNGIGFRVAATLAKWGANVTIACRNVRAGEQSVREIITETGATENRVKVLELDLQSLESVRKFAAAWKKDNSDAPLDILCNNAGIMMTDLGRTRDGFEQQFGTNHLGHFLLADLLTDNVKKAKGRVVNVSSMGHRLCPFIDYDAIRNPTPENYKRTTAYGWAKVANILHARELNKRFSGTGATAYSVHPGGVNANLGTGSVGPVVTKILNYTLMAIVFKTAQHGADAVLYGCCHPDAIPGGYHADCEEGTLLTEFARDADGSNAKKLWEESVKMVGAKA